MIRFIKISLLIIGLLTYVSCEKDPYEIEYAEGHPSDLVDNWIAFEFQGGNFEEAVPETYKLVTALDPNRSGSLIIDRIYNADLRVRTAYSDSAFSVVKGDQLEQINNNNYSIKYISIKGYVTTNPVLLDFAWSLANAFYEDMTFSESDIEDVILIRAGFYDDFEAIVDTVIILGYRKTGFEDVDY